MIGVINLYLSQDNLNDQSETEEKDRVRERKREEAMETNRNISQFGSINFDSINFGQIFSPVTKIFSLLFVSLNGKIIIEIEKK